jgi:uroporphyrinogen decarboxylase
MKNNSASTPRERVLSALGHRTPDRIPFTWGFGATPEMAATLRAHLAPQGVDWDKLQAATEDKIHVAPAYCGPACANPSFGIWGINVRSADYGEGHYAEFTDFPLAGMTTPEVIDAYPWPNPDWFDYASVAAVIPANRTRATQFGAGNPFELYCWMTGIEEALMNVLAEPALVQRALDHITGFLDVRLQRTLAAAPDGIDLVFFADDLGTQQGLLMSRDAYREVLQPFHRRLTNTVRRLAPRAHCLLHSDGAVFDVIPDLLDAGLDTLEAVQTDATGMEPERLKRTYGDRLSFQGAISVQHLLPHGNPATVRAECQRLIEVLGARGGYIAAPAHAIQVGTPPENVLAMLRTVLGDDDYERAIQQAQA